MTLFYAAVFLIYNCRVIFASAHDMHAHRCVFVLIILGCKRLEIRQNLAEQGKGQQEDSRFYLGGHKCSSNYRMSSTSV